MHLFDAPTKYLLTEPDRLQEMSIRASLIPHRKNAYLAMCLHFLTRVVFTMYAIIQISSFKTSPVFKLVYSVNKSHHCIEQEGCIIPRESRGLQTGFKNLNPTGQRYGAQD